MGPTSAITHVSDLPCVVQLDTRGGGRSRKTGRQSWYRNFLGAASRDVMAHSTTEAGKHSPAPASQALFVMRASFELALRFTAQKLKKTSCMHDMSHAARLAQPTCIS